MAAKSKRSLGRGLDALLRPERESDAVSELQYISLDRIHANRFQPRRSFDDESLSELADSIRLNGVLEPLLLRPVADGYELVAGERRLRAARLAQLSDIPAIVRFFDDHQTAEIALIENLQREDLNPIEEATAYRTLMQEFNLTQEELARRVGRSRPHIANTLRLLQLPGVVQDHLLLGAIEMGHARSMLSLPLEQQVRLAEEIIAKGLSVRESEARARDWGVGEKRKPRVKVNLSVNTFWEGKLRQKLQAPVRIRNRGVGGIIEIPFQDKEDLERLLAQMLGENGEL